VFAISVLLFKTDCQRLAGLFKRDRVEEAGRPQFNFEATKPSEVEAGSSTPKRK
jgi:hypothetical protein